MVESARLNLVELADSGYFNIVRSAVESLSKEVTGYLFGAFNHNSALINDAYPVITAERKKEQVSYGDKRAIKRLHRLDRTIRESDSAAPHLIGGYHTHVAAPDTMGCLSEGDEKFIKSEMSKLDISKWIEIVVLIGDRKFKNRGERTESLANKSGRLNVAIRDKPRHGYSMTFAAYLLDMEEHPLPKRIPLVKSSGANSK